MEKVLMVRWQWDYHGQTILNRDLAWEELKLGELSHVLIGP